MSGRNAPLIKYQPTVSKDPFAMVTQEMAVLIARNFELSGFDLRVLWFLIGRLQDGNAIEVHHARIAGEMSTPDHTVHRQNVTKAIASLVAANVLIKGEFKTYKLNPRFGFKGTRTAQMKALDRSVPKISGTSPDADPAASR